MRLIIIFYTIIGFMQICLSQSRPFEQFDFSNDTYTLVGIRMEKSEPIQLFESIGDWYIEDAKLLSQIKADWNFTVPGKKYACGYHYQILLLKNGEIQKEIMINLDCKEVRIGENNFVFDPSLITSIRGSFQKLNRIELSFNSIEKARSRYIELSQDTSIAWIESPTWLNHEGSFQFTYLCGEDISDCSEKEMEIMADLQSKINSKYPNERFQIQPFGNSNDEIFFEIKCDKSLFDIWSTVEIEKVDWIPYDILLKTYSRD